MIYLEGASGANPDLIKKLDQCWTKVLARPEVGFPALAKISPQWDAISSRIQESKSARKILVLGIGGSSLGTQVIAKALGPRRESRVYFLESPDPHAWQMLGDL